MRKGEEDVGSDGVVVDVEEDDFCGVDDRGMESGC